MIKHSKGPIDGGRNSIYSKFKITKHKLLIVIPILVLLLSFTVLLNKLSNVENTSTSEAEKMLTTVQLEIANLPKNIPIQVKNLDGDFSFLIPNSSKINLEPGKYNVEAKVDGYDILQKSFEVKLNENNVVQTSAVKKENFTTDFAQLENLNPSNSNELKITDFNLEKVQTENNSLSKAFEPTNETTDNNQEINKIVLSNNFKKDEPIAILNSNNIDQNQTNLSSDLIVKTNQKSVQLTENCYLGKVEFNLSNTKLKYFKVCPDTSNSGVFEYDLETNTETWLLNTSDFSNLPKIAYNPNNSDIVYTKSSKEFGIIQNKENILLSNDANFSAPIFSPDGEYLILLRNFESKNTGNIQEDFKLELLAVESNKVNRNLNLSDFKSLGFTYFVERPLQGGYEFYEFLDNKNFRAGDSDVVYSLNEEKNFNESDILGRKYKVGNNEYNYYKNIISKQNEVILTDVNKLVPLNDKLFVLSNSYLYRVDDSGLSLVYTNRILNFSKQNNTINLVLDNGEILTQNIM